MSEIFEHQNIYQSIQNLDKEEIEFRYEMEEQIIHAISTGNLEMVYELMEAANNHPQYDVKVLRFPENYLRDRKNALVTRKTFSRIAAKRGGLPPVFLHVISEKYALMIENATSVSYLDQVVSEKMFVEYCLAVRDFSTLNYSPIIKEIVSYISNHLSEQITLKDVAQKFHLNDAHLSRKFKKETGFTFIEYVNRHRIEYAKLLFQEGHSSVTNVASYSGFNSSSYFSKVFKSMTGESPSEYLDHLKRE